MFLPVVRSARRTPKTSLGISDSWISLVKSGIITSRARAQDVASRFIRRISRCVPIVPSLLSESSTVTFKRMPRIDYAIIPFNVFNPLGGNVNQKWRHRHRSDGRNDTMSWCVSQAKSQFADCPQFVIVRCTDAEKRKPYLSNTGAVSHQLTSVVRSDSIRSAMTDHYLSLLVCDAAAILNAVVFLLVAGRRSPFFWLALALSLASICVVHIFG